MIHCRFCIEGGLFAQRVMSSGNGDTYDIVNLGVLSVGIFNGWIVLFDENILNELDGQSRFTDTTTTDDGELVFFHILVVVGHCFVCSFELMYNCTGVACCFFCCCLCWLDFERLGSLSFYCVWRLRKCVAQWVVSGGLIPGHRPTTSSEQTTDISCPVMTFDSRSNIFYDFPRDDAPNIIFSDRRKRRCILVGVYERTIYC